MRTSLEKHLRDYSDVFGEAFPTFLVLGATETAVENMIKESLKTGEPYEPEIEEDADY